MWCFPFFCHDTEFNSALRVSNTAELNGTISKLRRIGNAGNWPVDFVRANNASTGFLMGFGNEPSRMLLKHLTGKGLLRGKGLNC